MKNWLDEPLVAIHRKEEEYLNEPPFHPAEAYPEYPFTGNKSQTGNGAYAGVRAALHLLGLDDEHYGSPDWNPLGTLIVPGDTVVLKPNLIRESHGTRMSEWEQIVTHGSLIRAVLDYVFIALKGKGRAVIADGPQTDSDFEAICQRIGLYKIVEFYNAQVHQVQLLDLRRDRWFQKGEVIYKRVPLPGDPAGYTTVELGSASEFSSYWLNGSLYGADYDMLETAKFHSNGRHAYVLCRTVMDADVVINLPKLKTHKKTGVTVSLKNLVGINGYRNCLPHHTIGTPDQGGDEFPTIDLAYKVQSRAIVAFKRIVTSRGGTAGMWARGVKQIGRYVFGDTNDVVRTGNWHGNDTAWRMVLDLNKALFYFNGEGKSRTKPLRYMTIVDGIIAGGGNGPITPDAVPAGLIVAGFNPVAVDTVCATLIGFDYCRIPVINRAWEIADYALVSFGKESVNCISDISAWNGTLADLMSSPHLGFAPHFGWKGSIERQGGIPMVNHT